MAWDASVMAPESSLQQLGDIALGHAGGTGLHRAMLRVSGTAGTEPGAGQPRPGQLIVLSSKPLALGSQPQSSAGARAHSPAPWGPGGGTQSPLGTPEPRGVCFPSEVRGQGKAKERSDANTSSAEGR